MAFNEPFSVSVCRLANEDAALLICSRIGCGMKLKISREAATKVGATDARYTSVAMPTLLSFKVSASASRPPCEA